MKPLFGNAAGWICCSQCGNTLLDPVGKTEDEMVEQIQRHKCPPPELHDTEQLREAGLR